MWRNWNSFGVRLILFCFENILLSYALSCDFYPCLDLSVALGWSKKNRGTSHFVQVLYDLVRLVIFNGFINFFKAHLCKYTCIFRNNNTSDNSTYIVSIPNRCGIKPRNLVLFTSNQAGETKFWRSKAEFWNPKQLSINQVRKLSSDGFFPLMIILNVVNRCFSRPLFQKRLN